MPPESTRTSPGDLSQILGSRSEGIDKSSTGHLKPGTHPPQGRILAVSLGLFLFSLYLFCYRGGFHSVDEVSIFAVTESLVKFGRFHTDQIAWTQWTTTQAEAQGFFGVDGHVYSKKGLALSLAQAPFYWLALVLPGLGMLQTVSLLNAVITAATAALIFMFLERLNFSPRTALITALIFGLATIAFVYAKYLFSEPLTGWLLLLAAYQLLIFRQEAGLYRVGLAGLAAAAAVLARANNLFLLPIFGLYLLWSMRTQPLNGSVNHPGSGPARSQSTHNEPKIDSVLLKPTPFHPLTFSPPHLLTPSRFLPLLIFGLAALLVGAVLMSYNALRSGNPFQTGYDLTLFSPNLLLGLYKLLFSPLRGLFIYSPILLLSLPGWWLFRQTRPAEAWLFAGLIGVTVLLFSAWSSGEGLSWGSRFLVPLIPFLTILLAPLVEQITGSQNHVSRVMYHASRLTPHASRFTFRVSRFTPHASHFTFHVSRFTFYILLPLSGLIQLLGSLINPWVFLAQLQADFGGEFFLENTAALYDFRYSQIVGQLQTWSLENSDLAWWQPWGFDALAFSLSLLLVILSGWLLWREAASVMAAPDPSAAGSAGGQPPVASARNRSRLHLFAASSLPVFILTLVVTYLLLARYFITDRQFGPPDDSYTQALTTATTQASPTDQIVTVAPYSYHVPMNRFKARIPLIGFAQQQWPLPETAVPLLEHARQSQNVWLVTLGFAPAAADNAAEQWLTDQAFKASDTWLGEARLVHFGTTPPTITQTINATLGQVVRLVEVKLSQSLQRGQVFPVELAWLAISRPPADYNLFLQLLNADGSLVAQHDSPPGGGYLPTSTWSPGQSILSRHGLAVPAGLPPGNYRLIAGLYEPTTGARLPVAGQEDVVELGSVVLNDS